MRIVWGLYETNRKGNYLDDLVALEAAVWHFFLGRQWRNVCSYEKSTNTKVAKVQCEVLKGLIGVKYRNMSESLLT